MKRSSVTGWLSGAPSPSSREQLGQRARIDDRAGEDVRSDLGALLDDADAEVLALLGAELLQADRGREARGARADHDHVVLHRFAFAHLSILAN
jgi:hypothetical protein